MSGCWSGKSELRCISRVATLPKNQPTSSLLSPLPYPLTSVEDGFVFETDLNVTYKIGFADDSAYISDPDVAGLVFSFSIVQIAGQVKQRDPRIEQTVVAALLSTFDALPDAVINYVCSLDDDQEAVRSRLFQCWYLKLGTDRFLKLDHINPDGRIYTSAIFRRNHPHEAAIRNWFSGSFDK